MRNANAIVKLLLSFEDAVHANSAHDRNCVLIQCSNLHIPLYVITCLAVTVMDCHTI